MERWQRTIEGRTERWELERKGQTLVERVVVEGFAPVTREALCDTDAMADSITARMIARHERAGFTRSAEGAPVAQKAEGDKAPRPSYPGLSDKQLGSILNGMGKAGGGDGHKLSMAIQKVVGDWQQRVPIAWFVVKHKLVAAETMPGLWSLLSEQPELVDAEALFELLTRLPTGGAFTKLYKNGPMPWFTAGFDRSLDVLLFEAYQRARALFDTREGELPAPVRTALDFVRGRSGVDVAPSRAQGMVRHIAKVQCEHGLASNVELVRLVDGEVKRPRVESADSVRAIALRFGTPEVWRDAMVDAVKHAPALSLYTQYDGLAACDLATLSQKLAGAFSFSDNGNLARILALLDARDDAPEALLEAATAITRTERHALVVRDMLAVLAAACFAAQGKAVPEALDALLDLSFFSGIYHASIAPYVKGLAALPRARALRLAERRLEEQYSYAEGLAPLLAHPDDALLARFFDKDAPNSYLNPRVVGCFGAAALPHLARVWEKTPRTSRRSRHQSVLEALATVGDRGETVDPSWDHFIRFDKEGDEPMKYWDPSYTAVRVRALAALPMERRVAQLVRSAQTKPFPERALAAAVALDDEGFASVMSAFIPRRSECEHYELAALLRALGDRVVAPLKDHRADFIDDAKFMKTLGEALTPEQLGAIAAG